MKPNDDKKWLLETLKLSHKCIPTETAFCVGSVIVDENGRLVSTGFSRETDPHKHAEEIAIEKALEQKADLSKATLYSSLEPCGERLSGRKTCVAWIIETGIKRVVFAKYEPSVFVTGNGKELLEEAKIETQFLDIDKEVM